MIRREVGLLTGVLIGLLSVEAWAQTDDIATLEAQARAAFRAGDYETAADAFGKLLVQLPPGDPARAQTQYNRGRALQESDRPCIAAEAFLGYLSNPDAAKPREARRRAKARKNLGKARGDCSAQKRTARIAPPPVPPPPRVSSPATTAQVVKPRTPHQTALVLEAGLGSGVHLSEPVERARTTLIAGLGYRRDALLFDLTAEFAIETPEGAEGVALIRPGIRWYFGQPLYLRASLPVLLLPLTAVGVQGALGLQWPQDGQISMFTELGGLGWFSDPVQLLVDGRLGVQASF